VHPDTLRYGCSNYTHVMFAGKNGAAVHTGDVGEPETLIIRQRGGVVPSEILVKHVGNDAKWVRFVTNEGKLNSQGNYEVAAHDKKSAEFYPATTPVVQNFQNAQKLWAKEYLSSFI
jgi:hypothetical protein